MTERAGKPVVIALTAGQRYESPQAIPLLERGLERMWPEAVAGDKGDSASALRNWLGAWEIEAVIPSRDDELGDHAYDRGLRSARPASPSRRPRRPTPSSCRDSDR